VHSFIRSLRLRLVLMMNIGDISGKTGESEGEGMVGGKRKNAR